jgi:CYTH domain-containing protein
MAILRASIFAKLVSRSEGRFTSTPTHGGDALGRELTGNHMFNSSGLKLTFEGLLLGASLHLGVKATSSNLCKSNFESAMPMHNARETSLCFVGKH